MDIEGKILLEPEWRPVVYLSLIDQFKNLDAASYNFLIAEIELDSTGSFHIKIEGLPENDYLYRLHICKINDPISTIIIGGQDENYLHFIGHAATSMKIYSNNQNKLFKHTEVQGHPANVPLSQVLDLKRNLNTPPRLSSAKRRSLAQSETKEALLGMIDTSSYSIVRLLALHFLEDMDMSPDLMLFERELNRVHEGDSSPYVKQLEERFNFLSYQLKSTQSSSFSNLIVGGVATFLLLLLVAFYYFRKKTNDVPIQKAHQNEKKKLDTTLLSAQEKRVWELLIEQKSNKEIAAGLNIEVTTVKSHIYRIYNKLGVSSRKEIWAELSI